MPINYMCSRCNDTGTRFLPKFICKLLKIPRICPKCNGNPKSLHPRPTYSIPYHYTPSKPKIRLVEKQIDLNNDTRELKLD